MTPLTDFCDVEQEITKGPCHYVLVKQCRTPQEAAQEIIKARMQNNYKFDVISGEDPKTPGRYNVILVIPGG